MQAGQLAKEGRRRKADPLRPLSGLPGASPAPVRVPSNARSEAGEPGSAAVPCPPPSGTASGSQRPACSAPARGEDPAARRLPAAAPVPGRSPPPRRGKRGARSGPGHLASPARLPARPRPGSWSPWLRFLFRDGEARPGGSGHGRRPALAAGAPSGCREFRGSGCNAAGKAAGAPRGRSASGAPGPAWAPPGQAPEDSRLSLSFALSICL